MTRILLVCMGNICRSPTAEGVLRYYIKINGLDDKVEVDSAGTHDYHVGEPADTRARRAAQRRGFDLSGLRARHVEAADFEHFDLILAMDRDNLQRLTHACPEKHRGKLGLFLRYATGHAHDEVPDPYFGADDGFELVLDLIEDAAQGLVDSLRGR